MPKPGEGPSESQLILASSPDGVRAKPPVRKLARDLGVDLDLMYRFRTADGRWVHLHDRVTTETNDSGQITALQGMSLDVSERFRIEQRVNQYADIVDRIGLPAGVFNLVHGFGPGSAGEAIVTHPGINGITFTEAVASESAPAEGSTNGRAPETPQAAATPEAAFHTVQSGESLWAISRRHGVSVEDIRRLNNLQGNNVRPGQRLRVR